MTNLRRHAGFLVFLLLLAVLMFGPLKDLMEYAWDWDNENASQIFLIPFITLMLGFQQRQKIFKHMDHSVLPALLVGMLGAGLVALSRTAWSAQLKLGDRLAVSTSAVIVLFLAGFLLFYGTRAFRAGMFPLLFLVFAIPIPHFLMDRAITVLQHGSADATHLILKSIGMPVFRQGTIFALPNITIEVAPECSGIRSGISLLILSVLACHMFLGTWWRRGVLILVAVPILIFKNALRISTLSYLAVHVDKGIIESSLHREGGIPFFVLGMVLIYPILVLLMRSEKNRLVPGRTQEVNP